MSKARELAAAQARITSFEPSGSGICFQVTPGGHLSVSFSKIFRDLSESEALGLLKWLIDMFDSPLDSPRVHADGMCDCIEVGDA